MQTQLPSYPEAICQMSVVRNVVLSLVLIRLMIQQINSQWDRIKWRGMCTFSRTMKLKEYKFAVLPNT